VALLVTAARLVMAAVLLRAAIGKARDVRSMAATIRALGAPRATARPGAMLVMATEIVVALAVLFRPDATATQAGIVALAALFALAGLVALHRDEPIRCSCFGAGGDGYLGVTQLIAFVPWIAGAAILRFGVAAAPRLPESAAWLAAASLAIAAERAAAVWKARSEARGDRRSAQETYAWLPSH
jgi:hypothetical protein